MDPFAENIMLISKGKTLKNLGFFITLDSISPDLIFQRSLVLFIWILPSKRNVMFSLCSFLLFFSSPVQAKEIDSDYGVGVGLNNWFGDIPALSVRYSIPVTGQTTDKWELQAEILGGFDFDASTRTNAIMGGRLLSAMVIEDNLNLLAGAGAGVAIMNKSVALHLQPAIEAQYFIFGLEYLSFNTGVGLDVTMGSGENAVSTSGKVLAGFHYWF